MPVLTTSRIAHRDAWELGTSGVYLTDGARLLRVVEPMTGTAGSRATLEDCATLEVRSYAAEELWSLRLRRVRPER